MDRIRLNGFLRQQALQLLINRYTVFFKKGGKIHFLEVCSWMRPRASLTICSRLQVRKLPPSVSHPPSSTKSLPGLLLLPVAFGIPATIPRLPQITSSLHPAKVVDSPASAPLLPVAPKTVRNQASSAVPAFSVSFDSLSPSRPLPLIPREQCHSLPSSNASFLFLLPCSAGLP